MKRELRVSCLPAMSMMTCSTVLSQEISMKRELRDELIALVLAIRALYQRVPRNLNEKRIERRRRGPSQPAATRRCRASQEISMKRELRVCGYVPDSRVPAAPPPLSQEISMKRELRGGSSSGLVALGSDSIGPKKSQ